MPFTGVNITTTKWFAGMPTGLIKLASDSYFNSEASQEMPFGTVIVQGATDFAALVAAAPANKMLGILRNHFNYAPARIAGSGELGTIGVKPKASLNIVRIGELAVVVGEAVTPSSPVRVRMDTNAGALGAVNGPGTFCTTASAGHTVRLPFARFMESVTGSGIIALAFDFTMRDSAVAD